MSNRTADNILTIYMLSLATMVFWIVLALGLGYGGLARWVTVAFLISSIPLVLLTIAAGVHAIFIKAGWYERYR